ncbi:MAG: hypothetical protein LBD45_06340 [Bacteroidales bacterium]|jgi:hypothetical protein|nr:hypothetical protein [Bacteroidales bacterium]
MKRTLIFIALVMSVMATANAQIQTATLQQTDGVQVFYGIDALINAVNAAVDGNTIIVIQIKAQKYIVL